MINLEKGYQLQKKDPKQKITIKRIEIKIEIQNKFYF
jgi:hypothetical protein